MSNHGTTASAIIMQFYVHASIILICMHALNLLGNRSGKCIAT